MADNKEIPSVEEMAETMRKELTAAIQQDEPNDARLYTPANTDVQEVLLVDRALRMLVNTIAAQEVRLRALEARE